MHALVQAEPRGLAGTDLEDVARPPAAGHPPRGRSWTMRTTCRSASQKTMSSDMRMKNMWIDFSGRPGPHPRAGRGDRAGRASGSPARARSACARAGCARRGRARGARSASDSNRSASGRGRSGSVRPMIYASRAAHKGSSMAPKTSQHDPLRDAREAALSPHRRDAATQPRGGERAEPAPICAPCWRAGAPRRRAAALGQRVGRDPADACRGRRARGPWARMRAGSAGGSMWWSIAADT